eukprot:TRINITY_DN584_c0_g1_i8.p1 TRINITY_DN584_c0_g1~~TRINITY_DN584_c0_g1_i8.p1  ORF type:complete len:1213 (+),score=114.06 TRINITY_DN584_c0_g1_i8:2275-5913(+)
MLTIWSNNIRSIKAEGSAFLLQRALEEEKPHLVLLQETWLYPEDTLSFVGYKTYRRDSVTCPGYRGLLTLVRNDISNLVSRMPDLSNGVTEVLTLSLNTTPPTLIHNIYHPPDQKWVEWPLTIDDQTVIAGDINGHHQDWSAGKSNRTGQSFREWTFEMSLEIINRPEQPTRNNASPDIVATDSSMNAESKTLPGWLSDHNPIQLTLRDVEIPNSTNHNKRKNGAIWTWRWNEANWDLYHTLLRKSAEKISKVNDVHKLAELIKIKIIRAAKEAIPGRSTKKPRAFTKIDPELEMLINDQNRMNDQNSIREGIRRVKQNIIECEMSGKDYKWAFHKVKQLEGKVACRDIDKLEHDGRTITDSMELSKTLNDRYANQFRRNKELPTFNPSDAKPDDASCLPFTLLEFNQKLRDCKDKKAPGPDGVWNAMLKNSPDEFKSEILRLINLSWKTNVVPRLWKRGEVIPLLKPGKKKTEAASYRPITLTSALCKVMEKMIAERLHHVLRDRINVRQTAFRKGRSALENLCLVTDRLLEAKASGQEAILLTFDLQKAFDAVQHTTLLRRMRKLGVPQNYLRWVQNYLTGRSITTKVNGTRCPYQPINTGVPQGSVLGPLLFLIYIDGLISRLTPLEPTAFADDIGLVLTATNIEGLEEKANRAVRIVQDWAEQSDVELNTAEGKTEYIHVSAKKRSCPTLVYPQSVESLTVLTKKNDIPNWFRDPGDNMMSQDERAIVRYRIIPIPELKQRGIRARPGRLQRCVSTDWDYRSELKRVDCLNSLMIPLARAKEEDIIPLELIVARKVHRTKVVRYLGVLFDEDLKFKHQAAKMQTAMSRGLGLLSKLARMGCRKCTLSCILQTVVLARSLYGAECCMWLLPKTGEHSISSINIKLNRQARIVTGCLSSTPLQELYHEADLPPLELQLKYNVARTFELFRLSSHLPVHELVKLETPESQWGRRAWETIKGLPGIDQHRYRGYEEPRPVMDTFPPWENNRAIEFVIHTNKTEAIKTEQQLPNDELRIYTDGSIRFRAKDFITKAGAGIIMTRNEVIEASGYSLLLTASSYRTEQIAIQTALDRIIDLIRIKSQLISRRVHILTDSMSTLMALERGPEKQKCATNVAIWKTAQRLRDIGMVIQMYYVPAHMGVRFNEAADMAAKAGANQQSEDNIKVEPLVPRLDYGTMMTYHRRMRKKLWLKDGERRVPFLKVLNRPTAEC